MRSLIDLSHIVADGVVTYPGLPAPIVCDFLSREASKGIYDEGTTFQIGNIEMVANTGTYIDSPFHRYASGVDLSGLRLESIADLEGVVIDTTGNQTRAVDLNLFDAVDVHDKAVLVRTDWDRHWATAEYFSGHPFLTEAIAVRLRDGGALLVGIDSLNIDDTSGGSRPVHSILLGAGIPIVEHMCNLSALPQATFRFHAAPVKFKGVGTFPVRAYAVVG